MSQIPPNTGGSPNYAPRPQQDDVVSTIIPFRNGWALASYYTGVFSAIPCVGAITGPVAVFLGIKGLRLASQNPNSKGKAHAWVGIITGSVFGLLYLGLVVMMIVGMIAASASR